MPSSCIRSRGQVLHWAPHWLGPVLIAKYFLYLALVLNFVFHSALPMCCIVKYLLYLALVLNYIHRLVLSVCCISKYLLYLALVLNYVFN